jgi:DNA-binding CsgD family transcriptional regulator
MSKWLVLYALIIGAAAFALQWLSFQHAILVLPTRAYIILIAMAFMGLGLWAGYRLTGKSKAGAFVKNTRALSALGLTPREYQVLEYLAAGHANKEIARRLGVSPNTIKTHLNRLYDKLSVERRTQAVNRARALALIP